MTFEEIVQSGVQFLAGIGCLVFAAWVGVFTVKKMWNDQRNYILVHGVTLGSFHQWWFKLPRYNEKLED